jgi:hypothetical protein
MEDRIAVVEFDIPHTQEYGGDGRVCEGGGNVCPGVSLPGRAVESGTGVDCLEQGLTRRAR